MLLAGSDQPIGFKRCLRAEVSEGVGAFLFSETGVTALRGRAIAELANMLDGTRDVASVLRARPGGLSEERAARIVDQLMTAGLVTIRPQEEATADEDSAAYWDACDLAPDGVESTPISVCMVGETVPFAAVEAALASTGKAIATRAGQSPADGAQLSVVVCDDYLNPALADVAKAHRAAGMPWLLAKPVGTKVWVGPVFESAGAGCWYCLHNRLWQHRGPEACIQAALGRTGPAPRAAASIPALATTATHLIALEAAKWLAGHHYAGQRRIWILDSLDLRGEGHELWPRPQCPHCGDPAWMRRQAERPVVLGSDRRRAGAYRSLPAAQILDRYRHLVSPVTGIVKDLKPMAGPDGPCATYGSGVAPPVTGQGLDGLQDVGRCQTGGKGVDANEAMAGALGEAVERYSGSFFGDEKRIRCSFRTLGELAIHPNECMLFDQRQYRDREVWNARHGRFQYVCEPFDGDARVDWTPVWRVSGDGYRYLPTSMLYSGAPPESGPLPADTNGCAAGASLTEAVLHGLFELVERDAAALWWYNRTQLRGIALESFGDEFITAMCAAYRSTGRMVWALDATSDLGIPSVIALSCRADGARGQISLGTSCHLDLRMAMRRALAELEQVTISSADGRIEATGDPDAMRWWESATVADHPYLLPAPDQPRSTPDRYRYRSSGDSRDDLDYVLSRLRDRDVEVFVLDQTRPDLDFPVAKVIAPGLRHFWARFAPGRLFDVPVALGRLPQPTAYEDLNPVPLFL